LARAADLEAGPRRARRNPTGDFERAFLDRKEWWFLVPDQTVFASGGNTNGQVLNLAAAQRWPLAYGLSGKQGLVLDRDEQTPGQPEVTARWINPKTGESKRIGEFSNSGVQSFSTPETGKTRC